MGTSISIMGLQRRAIPDSAPTGAFGMDQDASIRLKRTAAYVDSLRSYAVFVDGIRAGQINVRETLDLTIPPGQHEILLKIDWCSSNTLAFRAEPSGLVTLECGPSATGWRTLLGLLYISVWHDRYLWIRHSEPAAG